MRRGIWIGLCVLFVGWMSPVHGAKPLTSLNITQVYFRGVTVFTQRQLRLYLYLRRGDKFDRRLLRKDARRLVQLYQDNGYFQIKITVKGYRMQGGLALEFLVTEGPLSQIRRIEFHGNRHFSSEVLRQQTFSRATSRAPDLEGRTRYHPYYTQRDLLLLRKFYADHGFLQARISKPRIEIDRTRKWATLHFTIHEGPRFYFGGLKLIGDLLKPEKQLVALFGHKPGDVFVNAKFGLGGQRLLRLYKDAGYYYARFQPQLRAKRVIVKRPKGPKGGLIKQVELRVFVQIFLVQGPRTRIEKIEIRGNQGTRDAAIRARILLKPGDLYSEARLRRSCLRIFGLGLFLRNDAQRLVKVVVRKGRTDEMLILRFVVKEKPSWWVLPIPGLGGHPVAGVILQGRAGYNNVLGYAHRALASGLVSHSLKLWNVFGQYAAPYLLGSELQVSLFGFLSHQDLTPEGRSGFIRDTQGGGVSLTHPLGVPGLNATLQFRAERVSLTQTGDQAALVPVANYFSSRTSARLRLQLRWDRRDRYIGTTRGWVLYGYYDHAAPYLGSDYTLHRLEAGGRLFLPLHKRLTLKFGVTAGWSFSPDADGVLPFERFPHDNTFFLMRGYYDYTIGPIRHIASQIDGAFQRGALNWGGTKKFVFNAELDLLLFQLGPMAFRVVLFFDAGNVFDDHELLFQDTRHDGLPLGLYMNAGIGLNWLVPGAGLLRFEFGFPIIRRPGDPFPLFFLRSGEALQ